MKLNPFLSSLLSALFIMVGGFILFNLAFVLFALIVNLSISILGSEAHSAPPLIARIIGVFALAGITWLGLKIKLRNDIYDHTLKATIITMPLMVIMVSIGITLYQQAQWIILLAGALIIIPALYYVWKKKYPWMYAFAIVYVAILAMFILFSGMDI